MLETNVFSCYKLGECFTLRCFTGKKRPSSPHQECKGHLVPGTQTLDNHYTTTIHPCSVTVQVTTSEPLFLYLAAICTCIPHVLPAHVRGHEQPSRRTHKSTTARGGVYTKPPCLLASSRVLHASDAGTRRGTCPSRWSITQPWLYMRHLVQPALCSTRQRLHLHTTEPRCEHSRKPS